MTYRQKFPDDMPRSWQFSAYNWLIVIDKEQNLLAHKIVDSITRPEPRSKIYFKEQDGAYELVGMIRSRFQNSSLNRSGPLLIRVGNAKKQHVNHLCPTPVSLAWVQLLSIALHNTAGDILCWLPGNVCSQLRRLLHKEPVYVIHQSYRG